MKSPTLYEISNQYQFLLNELYDEENEAVREEIVAKLNEISDTAENKCINIVKVFKEFEKEYHAISEERKKMAKRESAFKNQIDRLKEYLRVNMENCQIQEIKCPQFVIKLQKNPPKVDTYNPLEIPDEYTKISVSYDLDRMRSDMKNGVIIPGARLINGNSVRIK